jgi:hypothetical protein
LPLNGIINISSIIYLGNHLYTSYTYIEKSISLKKEEKKVEEEEKEKTAQFPIQLRF